MEFCVGSVFVIEVKRALKLRVGRVAERNSMIHGQEIQTDLTP